MSRSKLALVIGMVAVCAAQAWAAPLLPGTSVAAVVEPDPVGGVVVAGPMVTPLIGAAFTGTLTSTVISGDTSNPYGGLTFVYEVANADTSIHSIGRVTLNGFAGFLTDVSYGAGGGLAPATMDRSAVTGDTVGYSFVGPPLGPTVLPPGAKSTLLVVQTDAPMWTTAIGNAINGSIAAGPIYSPMIPEPATLGFMALAGLGLLTGRRR